MSSINYKIKYVNGTQNTIKCPLCELIYLCFNEVRVVKSLHLNLNFLSHKN
jgi:hypothetical protein